MKQIEDTFKDFTTREDIAIVLINQFVRPSCQPCRHLISLHARYYGISQCVARTPAGSKADACQMLHAGGRVDTA